MQQIYNGYYQINGIDQTDYSPEVWDRLAKLNKYEQLIEQGCDRDVVLAALDMAKSNYYRWRNNYNKHGLSGLANQSKRPNRLRQRSWCRELEQQILQLRRDNVVYGKAKIAVLYRRFYGKRIAESTIGRIINKLVRNNKVLPVSFWYGKKDRKKRVFTGYAQRWKLGMKSYEPGELVQMDHMTVDVPGCGPIKHFSAVCPYTKTATAQFYKLANSSNAALFLQHVIDSFSFKIKSIQVDGGSEFMSSYEQACEALQIKLFVLPPRSPEYNGNVERINETFKYECYGLYDGPPNRDSLKRHLQDYVRLYNTYRPHQGLGHLTPEEFYGLIKT